MTGGDAIVFVVDDDAAMRRSLENLIRSVGPRVAAFADPTSIFLAGSVCRYASASGESAALI